MEAEIQELLRQVKEESDPIKKARLIKVLNKEKLLRINKLAQLLGVTSSYICNILRILRLPEMIVDGYYAKNINITTLYIISRLRCDEDIIEAYEKILTKNLNVAQTEEMVREKLYDINSKGTKVPVEVKEKIKLIFKKSDADANVKVVQTRIAAKIEVSLKGSAEKTSKFLKKISEDYL